MKLNKNSTAAKLYRWFYYVDERSMPSNLCPYAWKLLLMWILIIPYTLFSLIYQFKNKFEASPMPLVMKDSVFYNFISFCATAMLFGMLSLFLPLPGIQFLQLLADIGIALMISILISIAFVFIVVVARKVAITGANTFIRISSNRKTKKKYSSVFNEFIKAKINKHCPQIDWE